jgi:hypothetical protein
MGTSPLTTARRVAAAALLPAGLLLAACQPAAPPKAPTPPPDPVGQAHEWARRGDSVRAEQYLASALETGKDADQIVPELVAVCISAGHLNSALSHALAHLEVTPSAPLRLVVVELQFALGQHREARQHAALLATGVDPGGVSATTRAEGHYLLTVLDPSLTPASRAAHFLQYLELAPAGAHAAQAQSGLEQERTTLAADEPRHPRRRQQGPAARRKSGGAS